jgi:putative SbcD/Mre11-related phosphoesterase
VAPDTADDGSPDDPLHAGPDVEPLPDRPLALVDAGHERVLALADYHAGIEAALRAEEGVGAESRADRRRTTVLDAVDETEPDRLVVLGDFMHSIGGPGGAERGEIEVLLETIEMPVTVVRGNHDGAIDDGLQGAAGTDARGTRLGGVGFAHGHTWPAPEVLRAEVVCLGHEHPCVRLTDDVGGRRVERVWLRGRLSLDPFRAEGYDLPDATSPDLVVFPAFNGLSGGTWVNEERDFLCPFFPAALWHAETEAYLLDGTRLGPYGRV